MNRGRVNMVTGIVGALIGVMIGVAAYVGIFQLGYIAGISGAIMMICSIKGFELLGKGLNIPAIIICVLMVLAAIWFSNHLCYALEFVKELDYDFKTAWIQLPYFLEEFEDLKGEYLENLLFGYGLSLLAIIPAIRDFVRGVRGGAETEE